MNAQSGKYPPRVDPSQLARLIRAEIRKPLYRDAVGTRFQAPENDQQFEELLRRLDQKTEH
ncbi:hypothetical protein [Limoniibacter endophyticus]|uniref:Uncharacterized protein n=1 Tax=Limoniibacter endophyticus TaxID=1565040 RepID=A0A8J3DNC8_9HYPH|nr:hypothetical protein [Limoniibacter endophyticus]GHC70444.1 hypothetical protein GCM10010136_16750 [Limoniibacter endophyticus]